MGSKETKFADEYIFLTFNGSEGSPLQIAQVAAVKAGYVLPVDKNAKDEFCKAILNKDDVKAYIADQIAAFREKLSGTQRRNLWDVIGGMQLGKPSEEFDSILPLHV